MPNFNQYNLEHMRLTAPFKAFYVKGPTAATTGHLFGLVDDVSAITSGFVAGAIIIDKNTALQYYNAGNADTCSWAASGVFTNLRPQELKGVTWPAANGTFAFGVPFVIVTKVENKNGWTNTPVMPCKCRIIKAWSVNQSANGGQWKLGTAGGVADICSLQTVAASDTDVDYVTDLDDANTAVASGVAIGIFSNATLDAEIFVMCIPEA